jgi:membrane protein implicated in regulation of membrane protease activity
MAIISAVVALLSQDPIVWSVVIVTIIGTILVYSGKNLFIKSDSSEGTLNLKDLLSALLILIGTAIIDAVAQLVINDAINWGLMLKIVLSTIFTYLGTTIFTGQPKKAIARKA